MTEPLTIAQRLRDYRLTLEENVVICDRSAVDEAANRIEELENDLRIGMANFEAAEAKLAKVEAQSETWHKLYRQALRREKHTTDERDRLSAELAEARADYLNASRDASNLAGKLNAAEAVIERALESLCGDYPSMAADFRSFLASKEASHAE